MRRVLARRARLEQLPFVLVCVTATAATGGCYNGQEMVDRILQRVANDHLAEVDLGTYQITLPRLDKDPVATTLRLEIVAGVERRNAHVITSQLAEVETQLRHATILALRQTDRSELLEPELSSLRQRVAAATARYLTAAPIDAIAFRSFAVYED